MAEEKLTHWRSDKDSPYIGAHTMPSDGTNIILTIKEVKREVVIGDAGKKSEKPIAYFVEKSLPMVLNATNCKTIAALYGSPYIQDWKGKKIEIRKEWVKAKEGGKVEALRIVPKEFTDTLPALELNTVRYTEAVAHLKKGGLIGDIEAKHTLTSEVREKLLSDAAA
jgi:hypothetical protein